MVGHAPGVRHARYDVALLAVEGVGLPLKAAYLLAAQSDDNVHPHWECVAYALDPAPISRGAYRLEFETVDGRVLEGEAVLIRSVQGAHVFRGAGPLAGVDPSELR